MEGTPVVCGDATAMLSDPGVNIPGLFTEATSVQPTEQMTELLISLPIDAEAQAPGVVDQTFPVDATTQATLLPALEAAQPSLTALHSPQSAPASEAEQAPVVELAVTVEKAAAEMPVGRVDKLGRIYPAAKVECQVEGCTSDLQEESRYNRRYRICDVHRKLLAIAMEGQTLRFCQQCARLQPVDMFKEDRRSCQASLALHNKRQSEGASAAVEAGFMAPPKCQVSGCEEDLLKHKVYNQRYKICPLHRTQEAVDIGGQFVRFCQQCAKVHNVLDFEGTKRSCKEKLERINKRRLDLKQILEQRVHNPEMPLPVKASCQVAGCTSDPNEMKVYHIRNKVCNTHLTMDEVDIDGTMMRFCRQCARFQPVTEFDSMKRSCRVRLEKHNERRRVAAQNSKAQVVASNQNMETLQPPLDILPVDKAGESSAPMEINTPTPPGDALSTPDASAAEVSTSKSRKTRRPRGSVGGGPPVCQIPNCGKELKDEKPYNIRYKVCSAHLNMAEVVIENGENMRFCQQCARFQLASEFDGLKRSCRARLMKHNERGRQAYQKARAKTKDDTGLDAESSKLDADPPAEQKQDDALSG